MNRYKSCAELKNLAKIKLEGHFGLAISAILLVQCINYIVTSLVTGLAPGLDIPSMILSFLLSAVVSILLGVLNTGLAYFFLSMACGKPCVSSTVFYGFMTQPEKSVKVSLVHSLVNLVCLTPFQFFSMLFIQTKSTNYLLIMLVTMAVGLIIYLPVSLLISQTYFIIVDFPNYSAKEVLRTSCKIMKRHLWKLFYLELSFLPLMFLCVLTCGIGLIWLLPYMQMTYTCFYLDIMNPEKAVG